MAFKTSLVHNIEKDGNPFARFTAEYFGQEIEDVVLVEKTVIGGLLDLGQSEPQTVSTKRK